MNYLAHLFLSRHHQKYVLGNYLADMMKLNEINSGPLEMKNGVELHRLIDTFTDAHPANQEMKRKLRPYYKKYAGVALDIYYDFILYQNWDLYSDIEFGQFCTRQYCWLLHDEPMIPDRLRNTVHRMIEGDFLRRYTTIEGQQFAFQRMDRRASFYTGFEHATDILMDEEANLNEHFHLFFPDMVAEVEGFIGY